MLTFMTSRRKSENFPSHTTMSNDTEQVTNPPQENEEEDDRVPEEEVTEVEGWTPSVTLEVKAEVVTGEEQEEALFTQRSKLLRYVTNFSQHLHHT